MQNKFLIYFFLIFLISFVSVATLSFIFPDFRNFLSSSRGQVLGGINTNLNDSSCSCLSGACGGLYCNGINGTSCSSNSTCHWWANIPNNNPEFKIKNITCVGSVVWQCNLNYVNTLPVNMMTVLLFTNEKDNVVFSSPVPNPKNESLGTTFFSCANYEHGTFKILWISYELTDLMLSNPIKWINATDNIRVTC